MAKTGHIFVFLLLLPLLGCSSIIHMHEQKQELVAAHLSGNNEEVDSLLADRLESRANTGDEIAWQLEAGTIYFHRSDYAKSMTHLNRAAELMESYDKRAKLSVRDASAEAGAVLTNPNDIPYRGLSRDRVLLPLYNAFNRLAQNQPDNFRVEIRRMREAQDAVLAGFEAEIAAEQKRVAEAGKNNQKKLQESELDVNKLQLTPDEFMKRETVKTQMAELKQHSRPEYGNFLNPFTVFMSGYSFWRDNDAENALIEFQKLYDAFPANGLIQELYVAALKTAGRAVPEKLNQVKPVLDNTGQGILLLIVAADRGAAYDERRLDLVLPYVGYTGFAYPVCVYYPATVGACEIWAGGNSAEARVLSDMDAVVSAEYSARLPAMITRIVLGFLTKEALAIAAIIAANESDNDGVLIATVLATSAYKYMFNTADTRSWELLPKNYCIAMLPLPASERPVQLNIAGSPQKIDLEPLAKSAIIWVDAPTATNISVKIFSFYDK